MKRLRKEIGTFLFSTMLIVGICIVFRLAADIMDFMLYPGREADIMDLPVAVIWSILSQFITCGIFYMWVPFVNAFLHWKGKLGIVHFIVGGGYAILGILLFPVSWILCIIMMSEVGGLPYRWREISYSVPYVICYLVGVAQLVYDIVRKKSAHQTSVKC